MLLLSAGGGVHGDSRLPEGYPTPAEEYPVTLDGKVVFTINFDLHRNIQDAFNEYEVQIMSPHYLSDRPIPTVVPKDKWYEPPAETPGASASPRSDKLGAGTVEDNRGP